MIFDALFFGIVAVAVTAILWVASDALRIIEAQIDRVREAVK